MLEEIGHLNPETSEPRTRELTPKIKRININKLNPCFANYIRDATLVCRKGKAICVADLWDTAT